MSDIIGELTSPVNNALNDLGYTFTNFRREFLKTAVIGFRKQIDHEPVLKKLQKLINTVALIAETLLNGSESDTKEVEEEAVTLLCLICALDCCSRNKLLCSRHSLQRETYHSSLTTESSSTSLDYWIVEIIQSVGSVIFPFTDSTVNESC